MDTDTAVVNGVTPAQPAGNGSCRKIILCAFCEKNPAISRMFNFFGPPFSENALIPYCLECFTKKH